MLKKDADKERTLLLNHEELIVRNISQYLVLLKGNDIAGFHSMQLSMLTCRRVKLW